VYGRAREQAHMCACIYVPKPKQLMQHSADLAFEYLSSPPTAGRLALFREHAARVDVNASIFVGGRPLLHAYLWLQCEDGLTCEPWALRAILEAGADPNLQADGETPLMLAMRWSAGLATLRRLARVSRPDAMVCEELVRRGYGDGVLACWRAFGAAEGGAPGPSGPARPTHLLQAANFNDERMLVVLLDDCGQDPNALGPKGGMQLHRAARFGWAPTQILLDAGADANAKDTNGRTAYDVARTALTRLVLQPYMRATQVAKMWVFALGMSRRSLRGEVVWRLIFPYVLQPKRGSVRAARVARVLRGGYDLDRNRAYIEGFQSNMVGVDLEEEEDDDAEA